MPRFWQSGGPQSDASVTGVTSPVHPARCFVMLLLIVVLFLVGVYAFRMPGVAPASAPPDEFSAERSMTHVAAIAQEPHPMGSAANARVRAHIVVELTAMGLSPEVQESIVPDYYGVSESKDTVSMHNVIVRLPGTNSTKAIALMGHYDSVPTAPGAGDDGSAVAAMLEAARALRAGVPLQNDVILLFTDGEEPDQFRFGARAFVNQHKWAREIGIVLNFEALGRTGPSMMFETGPANRGLIREFGRAAPHPVAFSFWNDLYRLLAKGSTDYSAFQDAGVAGLNFAYFFERTVYHTALDNVENLDPRSLQHHGSYALALTRHFGGMNLKTLQKDSDGDAIYFSLFGAVLVDYPVTWALPLAILAGLLLVGVIVLGSKRKQLAAPSLIMDVLAFLLSVVAAVVLLSLAWWGIDELHLRRGIVVEPTYKAHLYLAGFLAMTVAVVGAVHVLFRRNAKVANLEIGALILWWILALLTSLYLKGFSYLFAWPLLFCLLACGAAFYWKPVKAASWRRVAVVTVGAAPGLILLASPVYSFFQAFGVSAPGFSGSPSFPIISFSIFFWAMLLGLLIPHMELIAGPRKWRLVAVVLMVGVSCIVVGSLLPGTDAEDLGLRDVGHLLNPDGGGAPSSASTHQETRGPLNTLPGIEKGARQANPEYRVCPHQRWSLKV